MSTNIRVALAVVMLTLTTRAAAQTSARPGEVARSDPARTVTLSLTEYNRLIDLANRPSATSSAPPVAAVTSSADLRVRVDRDAASGTFALAGDVLRPGINRLNLMSGATLMEASVDGRALPLVSDGNTHAALLPGPGPFNLTLAWGTPLTFAPGRASFMLPVPTAGTAKATLDIPGEQADVHVSAGLVTRRSAANGRTTVDVTLKPGVLTEVWWSMRDSAPVAAAREVRVLADVFTLVTIGDADVRMAALVDATIVQGEARTIAVRLPAGYELSAVSGVAIETSEQRDNAIVLTVTDPAVRRLQFLVTLERAHQGGSFRADTEFIALPDVQRERGEIAIEGVGTLELEAAERDGMHRVDVKELNPALQSLARLPLLAGFRYQRAAGSSVALAMNVQRFPDAAVLAAVADRATATTLITSEGRALTEVALQIRNRAQPFLKVTLPAGATIVSVEVAGETAKPVVGSDGTRVPLLRPGFRPKAPYQVSYVYMHAGTPFARKGELAMTLPRMDIPVGVVEWEMFVPDNYSVQPIDGNVIRRAAYEPLATPVDGVSGGMAGGVAGGMAAGAGGGAGGGSVARLGGAAISLSSNGLPGQIQAKVVDSSGASMPGTTVTVKVGATARVGVTGADGTVVLSGIPNGAVTATAALAGFRSQTLSFFFDSTPRRVDFVLSVAAVEEMVTVSGQSPKADGAKAPPPPPSQNVLSLQKRAAGVLPIRIDVPRAGTSHQFVKPLVVDQEATVTLRYKRR